MQFFTTTLLSLLTASAAANPLLGKRAPVPVGFGQEIQNPDQTNHWVVWIEGESACPAAQVLSSLTTSPCDQEFMLNGYSYHFTNCGGDLNPGSVVYQGNIIFDCTGDSDKITCHGDQHDIVKHGYCK